MALLKIDNFGGESPRTPSRQLPLGGAQVNSNLLATAQEFRPMPQPGVYVLAASGALPSLSGAKTIYRTQRNGVDHSLHTDPSIGWRHDAVDVAYVKGQLNDDTSERTYYTPLDGSSPPRVFDNTGQNYVLGIPPPPAPEVSVMTSAKFTREKAEDWLKTTLIPDVSTAVKSCMSTNQVTNRYTLASAGKNGHVGKSIAGVTKGFDPDEDGRFICWYPSSTEATQPGQRGIFEPWNLLIFAATQFTTVEGLANPRLGGAYVPTGPNNPPEAGGYWFGINALPYWGVLDKEALKPKLKAIRNPNRPDQALWNTWQVGWIADQLATLTSPSNSSIVSLRSQLDAAVQDYVTAALTLAVLVEKPVKGSAGHADETAEDFATRLADWGTSQDAGVSAMLTASARATEISHEIERKYTEAFTGFEDIFGAWIKKTLPLAKTDDNHSNGLVVIDDEAATASTRFYAVTYVTQWGEESAPSPVSYQLTVGVNDIVAIKAPPRDSVQTDRNITSWRLYRSNTGSFSAAFQLVGEMDYGVTWQQMYFAKASAMTDMNGQPAPLTNTARIDTKERIVGMALSGTGDENKWRDMGAVWAVRAKRSSATIPLENVGLFSDSSWNMIGDVVEQNNFQPVDNDGAALSPGQTIAYQMRKTWNGYAWVAQSVPDVSAHLGKQDVFIDGVSSAQLGEVCPTITWAAPPYRCDVSTQAKREQLIKTPLGVNPYLRGLTGMANGIMAGFVDNYVAFCEPYVPYAWPVEYQIPLEFPVVGLCAFGQSLVVGTHANPYIISGADSASMSSIKLNNNQSCVSAKSMVAAMGGVFYASPDGYCFASGAGVEVATVGLFAKEDWQKLNPASIFAAVHDNVLYFWYSGNGGGCYGLDMGVRKLTRHDPQGATAAFTDVVTDALYVVNATGIRALFGSTAHQVGSWRSGLGTLPANEPFAWVRVMSDWKGTGPVTVNWYADGQLRRTAEFYNNEPQRLPAGRYLEHEVEVVSQQRVTRVALASTTAELMGGE